MVVVKSYPEASDKDAIYWNGDTPIEDLIGSINSDTIEFQGSDVVSLVALFGVYVDSLGGYQHIDREAGKGIEDYRIAHEERLLEYLACKQSHKTHCDGRESDKRCRYADNGCDAVCAGACESLEQTHHQRSHNKAVGARLMEGVRLNELELVSGEAEQQTDNIHRYIALCGIVDPVSRKSDKRELEQYNSGACGSLLLFVLLVFRGSS